jgi:tetratricopeptide (TPR) repeat protein
MQSPRARALLSLTSDSLSFILDTVSPKRSGGSGGRLPSPSPDWPARPSLDGELVVFTGKLSSLGRKDARDLIVRLGGAAADDVTAKTTILVIGAEGFGPATESGGREKSNKLLRAEELNAQAGSHIRILTEDEFCRLVGVPSPQALRRQFHAMRDLLARYRLLREDHLRYLVKCGIIRAVHRTNSDTFFEFRDVAIIKQANDELEQGASFRAIVRSLIAVDHGQLAFDFRIDAAPAKILSLRRPATDRKRRTAEPEVRNTALAEEYFRAASALDDAHGDEATLEAAAATYRKALEVDPCLVAALINLANIHYGRDELAEAQALYERAIGLESDFFEAHFNLGNIYHDLARFGEAQACYSEALRLNPFYADAHFYLAVTLEKMGLSQEARPHWRSYQQLAPHGEWVELAKEFSE